MKLRQKVVLVLVATCLILAGLALIQGELHAAALGVFVSFCALLTNGILSRNKPLWRRRKG
jgi:hypothetical protein